MLEAWVDAVAPPGFSDLIAQRRVGLPTVHLEAEFKAVSRMGDDVFFSLQLLRVGGKSLTLDLRCIGVNGRERMAVKQTVVTTSLETDQAIQIPQFLRLAFAALRASV